MYGFYIICSVIINIQNDRSGLAVCFLFFCSCFCCCFVCILFVCLKSSEFFLILKYQDSVSPLHSKKIILADIRFKVDVHVNVLLASGNK